MPKSNATSIDDAPLVFVPEITRDNGVTDRAVRMWITKGKLPPADGNLNGRNFWRRSTHRNWQADVLAGVYHKASSLSRPASERHPAKPSRRVV
jgi:hypothetical protein